MYIEYRFEAYLQMTVERREEKVDKPILTGSAPGGDKFSDICNMETILPETDVLIKNAHFPSFTLPKFPFRRPEIANEVGNTPLRLGEWRADLQRTPTIKSTISNRHGLAGSSCSTIKGQLENLAY